MRRLANSYYFWPLGIVAIALASGCDNASLTGGSARSASPQANSGPQGPAGDNGGTPGAGLGGTPGADAVRMQVGSGTPGSSGGTPGSTGSGGGNAGSGGENGGNAGSSGAGGGNAGTAGKPGTPGSSVDGANANGGAPGLSTDGTSTNGQLGGTISTDGTTCFTTIPTESAVVYTSHAPFMQTPVGQPIDTSVFNQWEPHSGEHPAGPARIGPELLPGDVISVKSISGDVNDGKGNSSCANGDGQNASMKHVLMLQLTDDQDNVQDPGVPTTQSLGAVLLSTLETTPLTIPSLVTRAYVSVGDTKYSDNKATCTFVFVLSRRVPCPGSNP